MSDGDAEADERRGLGRLGGLRIDAGAMLAAVMGALFLFRHVPVRLAQGISPFDEGIRLASATLTTFGQIPYRDYYLPYGPAGAWLGGAIRAVGGQLIAHRLVFTVAAAVIVAAVVHVAFSRHGLFAALVVGGLLIWFATYDTYVFAYVAMVAAVAVLVGRRAEGPGFAGSPRRVVAAGLLLAGAVWFRFELASWLVVWSILAIREHGWRRWLVYPWAVGALPYVLVVLVGGLAGLWRTVDYAITDYRVTRALPVPWSAAQDLLGEITNWGSWEIGALETSFLLTLAYAGAAVIVVVAFGVWLVKHQVLPRVGGRTHTAGPTAGTGVSVLLWSTLALSWVSLSVRADAAHALNLVVPLLLFLSWIQLPRRACATRRGVADGRVVSVALVALLVATAGRAVVVVPQIRQTYTEVRSVPPVGPVPYVALGPRSGDELREILLLSRERGKAPVIVANLRNDIAFINGPFLFYILDRPTAAWPAVYDPGLANTVSVHRATIETNCQQLTDVVLWNAPIGPYRSVEDRRSPLLDRYIALNHRLEWAGMEFDYRVPDRETCLDPEAVPLAELARVRARRAAEGDLRAYAYLGEAQVDRDAQLTTRQRGDRALLAVLAGIPHAPPEDDLQERVFEQIGNARSGRETGASYSLGEGIDAPETTGVTLLTNALLAAHDLRVGGTPAVSIGDQVRQALLKEPELAGLVCEVLTPANPPEDLMQDLNCQA